MGGRGLSIWSGPANGSRRRGGPCRTDGSLFLNVGAKPKDPWTALDVAQAVRPHLELQNIIHWVKSIAIEKALAGARSGSGRRPGGRSLQADQQPPVSQRLPRVRLPFQPQGHDAARSAAPSA